jgi:hypothetical protein
MKMKVFYGFAIILLTLGCWWTARMNLGFTIVAGPILFVISGWLFIFLLTLAARRWSNSVWIWIGLLILVAWLLPASVFVKIFPIQQGEPFGLPLSFTLLAIISLALIVPALLFRSGLNLYKRRQNAESVDNGDDKKLGKYTGWAAAASIFLGLLLLISALYNFYWFMVWDTTYDGLGYLWLPLPTLAIFSAAIVVSITLSEKAQPVAFLYWLLIPVIVVIAASALRADIRQLTTERAGRVIRAIDGYYAREGCYPRNLRQLIPRDALSIPGPVIIYGQEWCYDGGDGFYRLGYIDREHWSAPHFIGRIYETKGEMPDLQGMCEREAIALQKRHPDFPYEYWVEGD